MRKIILFLTPLLIVTIIFLSLVLIINRDEGRGALQVTSIPPSQVFLDGKFIGKTPLCLCDISQLIKVGDYNIKLVPLQSGLKPYEQKITLYKGVLSVVDRTFDVKVSASTGSVITLSEIEDEDSSELLVISYPTKARVVLDSEPQGTTPLLVRDITASDHEIKILKDGYKEKIIKVKTIEGKRLEATVTLGIKPDINSEEKATKSAAPAITKVVILDTPTGFLRVRETDSVDSSQIATLNPGEKFDLISEKEEWFEIRLSDGRTGWISSSYARKE